MGVASVAADAVPLAGVAVAVACAASAGAVAGRDVVGLTSTITTSSSPAAVSVAEVALDAGNVGSVAAEVPFLGLAEAT